MHRAKCWNVHQVPKWPIRDRLNKLHDFGCKTMQIRSGSPMRWCPQQNSLQPALHRTTSLVEAPYELYNHSCHMHQTKFHIIQIKGKKSGHAQPCCAAFLVEREKGNDEYPRGRDASSVASAKCQPIGLPRGQLTCIRTLEEYNTTPAHFLSYSTRRLFCFWSKDGYKPKGLRKMARNAHGHRPRDPSDRP